jgi:hypothetical protein
MVAAAAVEATTDVPPPVQDAPLPPQVDAAPPAPQEPVRPIAVQQVRCLLNVVPPAWVDRTTR